MLCCLGSSTVRVCWQAAAGNQPGDGHAALQHVRSVGDSSSGCTAVAAAGSRKLSLSVWHGAHLEGAHESLVNAHHGAGIVELPAVVGRREDGHQLPLGKELVAILNHLQAWLGLNVPSEHGNHSSI